MPKVKQSAFLCPVCKLPTSVLRTKSALPQRLVRYRICVSGHKTTTRETVESEPISARDSAYLTMTLSNLINELGISITSDLRTDSLPDNPSHESSNNAT